MNLKYTVLIASGVLLGSAAAYSASSPDRRSFLVQSASSIASTTLPFVFPAAAMAEDGDDDGFITTESGLRYKVVKEGTGAVPSPGQTVKAHYTGTFVGFHRLFESLQSIVLFLIRISFRKAGWMDLILRKSLIRVAIVDVPFNLPLAKGKSFG